jgi:CDP-diacylglycerol--glycerol-3-phosphate 3-phosphatidyltransferase
MSRAPSLGWPNRISIARALLVAPFVVCMLNLDDPQRPWVRHVAVVIFSLMAASDWLDGWLARRLGDVSPLGAFLDPLGDKLLITSAVILLAAIGVTDHAAPGERLRLPSWVVVSAISKDLGVLLGVGIVRLATGRTVIAVRRLGKWCTTVQFVMALSMLLWPDLPAALRGLPRVLWWAAGVLAAASLFDYLRNGYRLAFAAAPTTRGASHE